MLLAVLAGLSGHARGYGRRGDALQKGSRFHAVREEEVIRDRELLELRFRDTGFQKRLARAGPSRRPIERNPLRLHREVAGIGQAGEAREDPPEGARHPGQPIERGVGEELVHELPVEKERRLSIDRP